MSSLLETRPISSTLSQKPKTAKLTPTEKKVIYLISTGLSSQEVADSKDMYVSKRTVDFHLANIYDKLGVNNRVQAMRILEHLGIMPNESCLGRTEEV